MAVHHDLSIEVALQPLHLKVATLEVVWQAPDADFVE